MQSEVLINMRLPIEQRLPAGLIDSDIEIFYHQMNVYALIDGKCLLFENWPTWLYDKLDDDMSQNPTAIQSLIDLGIEERLEMLWQYARCRFGSFDGNPDIDHSGKFQHTEYWDCGYRGQCPHEGLLCSSIKVENGFLTKREIDVVRLVADDLMNKEIADRLEISEKTVPVHKQNILRKIAGKRTGDIIKFAITHNIIHNK